ncbi:MAG: hypothetical protein OIF48_18580 [Silicimonas sp.]|nr:hypothetical protein [Silicimonas sp.]
MLTLLLILHIFIGSTLAGTGVIIVLSLGITSTMALIASAAIGFLVAFPVSWVVAKRITAATGGL